MLSFEAGNNDACCPFNRSWTHGRCTTLRRTVWQARKVLYRIRTQLPSYGYERKLAQRLAAPRLRNVAILEGSLSLSFSLSLSLPLSLPPSLSLSLFLSSSLSLSLSLFPSLALSLSLSLSTYIHTSDLEHCSSLTWMPTKRGASSIFTIRPLYCTLFYTLRSSATPQQTWMPITREPSSIVPLLLTLALPPR